MMVVNDQLQLTLGIQRRGSRNFTGAKLARRTVISCSNPLSLAPWSYERMQRIQALTPYAGPCQGWGRGFKAERRAADGAFPGRPKEALADHVADRRKPSGDVDCGDE